MLTDIVLKSMARMVKWQTALKPLFLVYNGTALSGLDATGSAFRKALFVERSHPIPSSLHPSSGRKLSAIFKSILPTHCSHFDLDKPHIVLSISSLSRNDSLTTD